MSAGDGAGSSAATGAASSVIGRLYSVLIAWPPNSLRSAASTFAP
jgi:hypothetical protein